MAERKTREELELIKKEHNVSDIYSWSRYNLSKTDMYSYYLKYITRTPEDRADSIYSYAGSLVHDLMEDFYSGKKKYEELAEIYEDKMFEFQIAGYKFDRNDEEKNEVISNKYNYCNKHYLQNFNPIVGENMKLEDYVLIKIGKFLFNGYSDFEYESKGKKHIVDFKTSTIYKGEKVDKEKGQLLLYALGKVQEGWAVEDIIIGWLFTKYITVYVPWKDGLKRRDLERSEVGSKLKASMNSQLKKIPMYSDTEVESFVIELIENHVLHDDIPVEIQVEMGNIQTKKSGELKQSYVNKLNKLLTRHPKYSEREIELILEEFIITNDFSCIPKDVLDLYVIEDCFVEIPFDQSDLDNLTQEIIEQIVKIHKLTSEYNKDGNDKIFYSEIDKKNNYFFSVLSGYSPKLHKPYKEYLDSLDLDKTDDKIEDDINDILADLGIDI